MHKTRPEIKKIINKYKEVLRILGVNAESAVLYGSYAKGNPHKDSDIDLVIVSKDFKKMNLRERLEVLGIAAVRIMQPIEAKGYTPEEIDMKRPASFLEEILATGINI